MQPGDAERPPGISRRSFLGTVAGGAAMIATNTLAAEAVAAPSTGEKETVVAFGAHPLDGLIGAATLLKHAQRGDRVIAVPLTLGLGHLWKPSKGMFGLLKNEQTAGLKTLAQAKEFYTDITKRSYAALAPVELHQLDLEDSPLVTSKETIKAVAELLRRYQPSIVLTHHPTMPILAGHADHQEAGKLVLQSIMYSLEETFQESAHPVPPPVSRVVCYASGDRWQHLGQADAPNLFVDVASTAAAKDRALLGQAAFGATADSLKEAWAKVAQPGYPYLEAFVQLRPVVVDYLRSNPGKPWLAA